jgi:hypothetical protein
MSTTVGKSGARIAARLLPGRAAPGDGRGHARHQRPGEDLCACARKGHPCGGGAGPARGVRPGGERPYTQRFCFEVSSPPQSAAASSTWSLSGTSGAPWCSTRRPTSSCAPWRHGRRLRGDRKLSLCRDTQAPRGDGAHHLFQAIARYTETPPKGEFVLVVPALRSRSGADDAEEALEWRLHTAPEATA